MLFAEIIKVALGALRANVLRSILTMLGIVIGVGAVIAMVAMSQGAQKQIQDQIAALGTTLLTVNPGQQRMGGVASETDRAPLEIDAAYLLRDSARYVTQVQPEKERNMQVQWGAKNANIKIVGTTPNYPEVRKHQMLLGRFFSEAEDAGSQRVAVMGVNAMSDLDILAPEVIIDQPIKIAQLQFKVIGILQPKGSSVGGGGNPDDNIYIPIGTARHRIQGGKTINRIYVIAESEALIPNAMAEIERLLRRQNKIRPGRNNNFSTRDQSEFLQTRADVAKTSGLLLAGIAGVSLIVGGIGIMNIMLVSVTERTREIGVRKALGATRGAIMLQFLTEAIVLCILGGIIGVASGTVGAFVLARGMRFEPQINMYAVIIAVAFSGAVGVLFGSWPAHRAARLDPIQALRYE
jgi:ABC-type antimicrobial peptide transport system permease subunit